MFLGRVKAQLGFFLGRFGFAGGGAVLEIIVVALEDLGPFLEEILSQFSVLVRTAEGGPAERAKSGIELLRRQLGLIRRIVEALALFNPQVRPARRQGLAADAGFDAE